MKLVKRIFVSLLILLTFNLYLPKITFAGQVPTKHPLEIRTTPEEDIPVEVVREKRSKWPWIVLGVLATGGAAVYYLQKEEPEEEEETGNVTGTW